MYRSNIVKVGHGCCPLDRSQRPSPSVVFDVRVLWDNSLAFAFECQRSGSRLLSHGLLVCCWYRGQEPNGLLLKKRLLSALVSSGQILVSAQGPRKLPTITGTSPNDALDFCIILFHTWLNVCLCVSMCQNQGGGGDGAFMVTGAALSGLFF